MSLFFIPLLEPLQQLRYAYAPALIAVGVPDGRLHDEIDFEDLTEVVPAFVTLAMMVFSYNIANGLTAGLVIYPLLKVFAGRIKELNWGGRSAGAAVQRLLYLWIAALRKVCGAVLLLTIRFIAPG